MTAIQRQYLRTVAALSERLEYAPTEREIADEVGRAKTSVRSGLIALERQGLIARDYGTARSMRLTDAGRTALEEGKAA